LYHHHQKNEKDFSILALHHGGGCLLKIAERLFLTRIFVSFFSIEKRKITTIKNMLQITQHLLTNPNNHPALKDKNRYQLNEIRGVVVHWTANPHKGAGAKAHRSYFNKNKKGASAHYVVENEEVICCIPENEVAHTVGDKPRSNDLPLREKLLAGTLHKNPNYYTINIEMCVNVDSDWTKTVQTTVLLCQEILDRHNLSIGDLYRHYDITGKDCPKMFLPIRVGNLEWDWNWEAFKSDVAEKPVMQIVEKEVVVEKWRETLKPINEYSAKSLLLGLVTKIFSFSWLKE